MKDPEVLKNYLIGQVLKINPRLDPAEIRPELERQLAQILKRRAPEPVVTQDGEPG